MADTRESEVICSLPKRTREDNESINLFTRRCQIFHSLIAEHSNEWKRIFREEEKNVHKYNFISIRTHCRRRRRVVPIFWSPRYEIQFFQTSIIVA